jgi:hypothetical protein
LGLGFRLEAVEILAIRFREAATLGFGCRGGLATNHLPAR